MMQNITFENGKISNFQWLVTLTLDRVILNTSCITHQPRPKCPISLKSKKLSADGCTYVQMDGHLRPTLLWRLKRVDLKTVRKAVGNHLHVFLIHDMDNKMAHGWHCLHQCWYITRSFSLSSSHSAFCCSHFSATAVSSLCKRSHISCWCLTSSSALLSDLCIADNQPHLHPTYKDNVTVICIKISTFNVWERDFLCTDFNLNIQLSSLLEQTSRSETFRTASNFSSRNRLIES